MSCLAWVVIFAHAVMAPSDFYREVGDTLEDVVLFYQKNVDVEKPYQRALEILNKNYDPESPGSRSDSFYYAKMKQMLEKAKKVAVDEIKGVAGGDPYGMQDMLRQRNDEISQLKQKNKILKLKLLRIKRDELARMSPSNDSETYDFLQANDFYSSIDRGDRKYDSLRRNEPVYEEITFKDRPERAQQTTVWHAR